MCKVTGSVVLSQIRLATLPDFLAQFWSELLSVTRDSISVQHRETGSYRRAKYGFMKIRTHDTVLCAKVRALMDWLKEQWTRA
jgi:hypothetical protein